MELKVGVKTGVYPSGILSCPIGILHIVQPLILSVSFEKIAIRVYPYSSIVYNDSLLQYTFVGDPLCECLHILVGDRLLRPSDVVNCLLDVCGRGVLVSIFGLEVQASLED